MANGYLCHPWNRMYPDKPHFPFKKQGGLTMMNSNGYFTTVDGVPVRKLYVTNFPKCIIDREVIALFSRFGEVIETSLIKNPMNGKPFGFVTFQTPAEATNVLKKRSLLLLKDKKLTVSPADSWHQPVELPNGQLDLNRRRNLQEVGDADVGCPDPYSLEVSESCRSIEPFQPDDSCPVMKLNDDCLRMIFNCIPMKNRLNLHKVCQRWNSVIMPMWYSLKKLDFTSPDVSDGFGNLKDKLLFKYVTLCPNITSINIATDDHNLSSNALVHIAKNCPNLEELSLRELKLYKRTLAFLAKSCTKLKTFSTDVCTNTHDGEMLGLVKNSHNLENIILKFGTSPSGYWMKHMKAPLKSLSLELYDFDPDLLMIGISRAKDTLRELKFVSCDSLRSKDIETISRTVPELTQLTLAGGSFSDFQSYSLLPITKLKKLEHLNLDNNLYVCDKFLEELSENCRNLKTLTLSGLDDRCLTNKGLSKLSKCTELTYLTLAGVRNLTDSMLKSMSQKIKGLKHLSVMGCSSITDEGCQSIVVNCRNLETFDVSGCGNVTNQTIVTAAESTRGTGRKLTITVGDSGIDMGISCPPNIILDPSSSIMSQYPGTMFILDPDFEHDNDLLFNNLLFDDLDDIMSDDDDFLMDGDDDMLDYEDHFGWSDTCGGPIYDEYYY